MKTFYSILISVVMVVTGQSLLKIGLSKVILEANFKSFIGVVFTPYVFFGLLLMALSSIIWLSILSKEEISYAYPMISIGYVVVALIGFFYFNEQVSVTRWAGIFTICFGVFLMSRSKK